MPSSQRGLPSAVRAKASSQPAPARNSMRVSRCAASCSQYQSLVRLPSSGCLAGFAGARRFFMRLAMALPKVPPKGNLPYLAVRGVEQMRDRIRIVAKERQFFLPGAEHALALLYQAPQRQHAQAYRQGVVEVAPRHIDVRAFQA